MGALKKIPFILILVLFMSACSISDEEMIDTTLQNMKQTFEEKQENANNKETDIFSLFLPEGFEVSADEQNNVILEQNGQQYILFGNQLEAKTSTGTYEGLKKQYKFLVIDETNQTDDRFGFLLVNENQNDSDVYEVVIGIGGIKLTTETSKNDVPEDVKNMIKIVSSVHFK